MYAGYLKNLANRVPARTFHIQSQEFGNRRRYIRIRRGSVSGTVQDGATNLLSCKLQAQSIARV